MRGKGSHVYNSPKLADAAYGGICEGYEIAEGIRKLKAEGLPSVSAK